MLIGALESFITREAAVACLGGRIGTLLRGRLRLVRKFYIPYHLFEVDPLGAHASCVPTRNLYIAIDAVNGRLDPLHFDHRPDVGAFIEADTVLVPELDVAPAAIVLDDVVRKQVYARGFFRTGAMDIASRHLGQIFVPYWVGFHDRNGRVGVSVVNGLNGRQEGAKVKAEITKWFQETPSHLGSV